ncbi:MAG: Uma2 family endonuclease [Desulfobacteraceae bacterium]|nr:Uma2 family endonuclease [Desulfobacteraceae bacterium]
MSPSLNHSYLCKRLIVELEKTEQWEAWPELTLDIETGIIPDIAVYERDALRPNFHEDIMKCAVLPTLVIEVVSPSQSIHELMQKAEKFLRAGIPAVWTIEPYGKIIYVSQKASRNVEVAGVVTTEGVSLDFSKIFGDKNS